MQRRSRRTSSSVIRSLIVLALWGLCVIAPLGGCGSNGGSFSSEDLSVKEIDRIFGLQLKSASPREFKSLVNLMRDPSVICVFNADEPDVLRFVEQTRERMEARGVTATSSKAPQEISLSGYRETMQIDPKQQTHKHRLMEGETAYEWVKKRSRLQILVSKSDGRTTCFVSYVTW